MPTAEPHGTPDPAIGSRLRELRQLRGWTQQQLATELGLAKSTVSQYENNINEPDLKMLVRLCRLFGVSADDFLGISESSSPAVSAAPPQLSADEELFLSSSLEAYRLALSRRDQA